MTKELISRSLPCSTVLKCLNPPDSYVPLRTRSCKESVCVKSTDLKLIVEVFQFTPPQQFSPASHILSNSNTSSNALPQTDLAFSSRSLLRFSYLFCFLSSLVILPKNKSFPYSLIIHWRIRLRITTVSVGSFRC